MFRDLRLVVGAAAVTCLAMLSAPTHVLAQATPLTQVTTSPFGPVVIVSACTGDTITVSGTERSLLHATFDSTGGGHFRFFTGQNGSGVGTSGKQYTFGEASGLEGNFPGTPFEFTLMMNSRLITSGPNNNEMIHSTVHVTFNANGSFTADVANFQADCQ